MHFYHYCICKQLTPGVLAYRNGFIESSSAITTPERHAETIQKIADNCYWNVTEMVVLSLSLLGATDNGSVP